MTTTLRKVSFKWGSNEPKEGLFHQWAQEADGEGQSNPVAIIEMPDGHVETVYAAYITFLKPPASARVDVRNDALEEAAKAIETYEYMMDRKECAAIIRALKHP